MRGSTNAQKAETDLTSVNSAITSLQNNKQNKLTFDTVPVSGSSNPITSGAVYDAFDNAGYVSNQIVPLGYFTATKEIDVNQLYGSGSSSYSRTVYPRGDITYISSTTSKNKSSGLIEITSSDSISINVISADKTFTTKSLNIYRPSDANIALEITVNPKLIPDGNYVVKGSCTSNLRHSDSTISDFGITTNGEFVIMPASQNVTVSNGKMILSVNVNSQLYQWMVIKSGSSTNCILTVYIVFTSILQQS